MNLQDNLTRAEFFIGSLGVEGIKPMQYGAKELTEVNEVTGHSSCSVLWLLDSHENRLQTMVRIVATKEGEKFVFDVYSDIVEDGFDPETCLFNTQETTASRTEYITKLVDEGYEILGWVEIPEIKSHNVPTY